MWRILQILMSVGVKSLPVTATSSVRILLGVTCVNARLASSWTRSLKLVWVRRILMTWLPIRSYLILVQLTNNNISYSSAAALYGGTACTLHLVIKEYYHKKYESRTSKQHRKIVLVWTFSFFRMYCLFIL